MHTRQRWRQGIELQNCPHPGNSILQKVQGEFCIHSKHKGFNPGGMLMNNVRSWHLFGCFWTSTFFPLLFACLFALVVKPFKKLMNSKTDINLICWAGSGHSLCKPWDCKIGGLSGFAKESKITVVILCKQDTCWPTSSPVPRHTTQTLYKVYGHTIWWDASKGYQ